MGGQAARNDDACRVFPLSLDTEHIRLSPLGLHLITPDMVKLASFGRDFIIPGTLSKQGR